MYFYQPPNYSVWCDSTLLKENQSPVICIHKNFVSVHVNSEFFHCVHHGQKFLFARRITFFFHRIHYPWSCGNYVDNAFRMFLHPDRADRLAAGMRMHDRQLSYIRLCQMDCICKFLSVSQMQFAFQASTSIYFLFWTILITVQPNRQSVW